MFLDVLFGLIIVIVIGLSIWVVLRKNRPKKLYQPFKTDAHVPFVPSAPTALTGLDKTPSIVVPPVAMPAIWGRIRPNTETCIESSDDDTILRTLIINEAIDAAIEHSSSTVTQPVGATDDFASGFGGISDGGGASGSWDNTPDTCSVDKSSSNDSTGYSYDSSPSCDTSSSYDSSSGSDSSW